MPCETTSNCNGSSGLGGSGGTISKIGVKILASHPAVGVALTSVSFRVYKAGSPTGSGYAKVYDSSGTLKGTSTTTVDWSLLPPTYPPSAEDASSWTFGSPVTLAAGDRIVIEGGFFNGSNEVNMCASIPTEYSYQCETFLQSSAWVDTTTSSSSWCWNEGDSPTGSDILLPPPVAWI